MIPTCPMMVQVREMVLFQSWQDGGQKHRLRTKDDTCFFSAGKGILQIEFLGLNKKYLINLLFFTHWRCVKRCHVFPVLLGDTLGCTSWGWAGWREDEASRPPPTSSPESRNCNKIIMRIQQKNLSFSLNYFVKKILTSFIFKWIWIRIRNMRSRLDQDLYGAQWRSGSFPHADPHHW